MRFFSIGRTCEALKLINRHALLLGPLLAVTFSIIAGWVATDYGAQYLFRDNLKVDYFGVCPYTYLCILQSARFHSALYATALMGLVWTLFVLIESWDSNAEDLHPVAEIDTVLPGVVLLGLVMVLASLFNRDEHSNIAAVLALSALGFLAGLILVAVVTKLGLLLSKRIRCHQVWTFMALSICVAIGASFLPVVTPSKAIFIALATVVMVYCAFELAKAHYRFPLVVLIVGALMAGSLVPKFKYEFQGLERRYAEWPNVEAGEKPAPLLDLQQTLDAWFGRQRPQAGARSKLVVVASSGGAYRATFWTAIVLDKLVADASLPDFDRAIRLMTGASGGMIGSAYFAASRPRPGDGQRGEDRPCASGPASADMAGASGSSVEGRLRGDLESRRHTFALANSAADSLTPVVQRLIGMDAIYAFWPAKNPLDRGQVLENQWETLQFSFCQLAAGEREGWRPSLIVSPYLVDSARPMFISNLNLKDLIKSDFAVEFFQKFPDAYEQFKLATAVRMSSTFPLISPAVRLPLPDRSRVVDAGYFDNFGITAAAMFLRDDAVRRFVGSRDLDVILIRVLAYREAADPAGKPFRLRLEQIVEQVTSPLEGALAARETRGRFANDLLLEDLARIYQGRFHQFQFVNPSEASFSWHIQARDLEAMEEGMSSGSNRTELEKLRQVWAGRPKS